MIRKEKECADEVGLFVRHQYLYAICSLTPAPMNSIFELIREAKEKHSKNLDLKILKNPPAEIPDDLYELTDLESLDFGRIPISDLSPNITRLTKLKEFSARHTQFKHFPLVLLDMPSLTDVLISSPLLKTLPSELKNWQTLTYLFLDGCSSLSEFKGLPPNLRYFNLSNTGIQSIPDEVYTLGLLNKIVIHQLGLTSLPLDLFSLNNLRALFVGNNKLSTIPKEITRLESLTELMLYNNFFENVPKEITELINLKVLDLSRNSLRELPVEFTKLRNLESLNLCDNLFEQIPPQLEILDSLQTLDLNNIFYSENEKTKKINQISIIPSWISKLDKLKELRLDTKYIQNVPEEIVGEGIEAIKNFFLSKLEADKEVFLYEAKMVVVGRGNVGKTVLTKRLTINDYILSKSDTTIGIDILKNPFLLPIKHENSEIDFKFNIWDFGGQEKYDATHQLFITNRSVYLFLTEAREESNYSDFQFWLNTIKLFSKNSPVIVVLSKCDERRKLLPESVYKKKFDNIVDFVDVSCATDYEFTITNLKNSIKKAIELLPQMHQKLSNHWVEIREELEKLGKHKDFIMYSEYLVLCKQHGLNKKQADFLSQYLNDLGVIIHHQHDLLLRKTVFINTDWCVDGMYKVLDDNKVFNNNGKFTIEDLQSIWDEERFEHKQEELLKLMKEYKLCFELKDGSGFLAPDLLPPDKIDDLKWDDSENLHFEYKYVFMPAGLLSRFIVKSHSFIKNKLYWKYGVVLEYEKTYALVEEDYINSKINISLKGDNKKGLLSAIRMFIDEVHQDFDRSKMLEFEEMIPCNCPECVVNSKPHFFKFDVLKRFASKGVNTVNCEKSVSQVQIDTLLNDVQLKDIGNSINTNSDLNNFIAQLIVSVLEKDVTLKGGFMNFWRDAQFKEPKNEIEIQPYITNTLDNFCRVNGINLTREVREANGSVDVMFSYTNVKGQVLKTCMEIKKAHHANVETAIKTQLPMYMKSASTETGIYLIVWFKHKFFSQPTKFDEEKELLSEIEKNNPDSQNIRPIILNCCKKENPSKM